MTLNEIVLRREIDRLETQLHEAAQSENDEYQADLIRSVLNLKYTKLSAIIRGRAA